MVKSIVPNILPPALQPVGNILMNAMGGTMHSEDPYAIDTKYLRTLLSE